MVGFAWVRGSDLAPEGKAKKTKLSGLHPTSVSRWKLRDSSWSSGLHSLLSLLDGMWDHKLVLLAVSPLRFFERNFKAVDVISRDYLFALHISLDIIDLSRVAKWKIGWSRDNLLNFSAKHFSREGKKSAWLMIEWAAAEDEKFRVSWDWLKLALGESRTHHRSHCSSKLQFFIRWFLEHGKRSPKFIVEAAAFGRLSCTAPCTRRMWKRYSTHLQFMAQLE